MGEGERGGRRASQRNGGWCCHQPPLSQLHGPPAGAASRWAGGSRTGAGPFVSRCRRSGRRRSAAPSCVGSPWSRSLGEFPPVPVPARKPPPKPFDRTFGSEPPPSRSRSRCQLESRRRSRLTAPLKANLLRYDPPCPKRGRFPVSFAAFGSSVAPPKKRPSLPRMVPLDVVPASAFAAARPASRLAVRFRVPSRFSVPRRDRNRFGSACCLSVFRFVSSASPRLGYRSDAVTLCESHQADSACG
jgi:hypothetical protein